MKSKEIVIKAIKGIPCVYQKPGGISIIVKIGKFDTVYAEKTIIKDGRYI